MKNTNEFSDLKLYNEYYEEPIENGDFANNDSSDFEMQENNQDNKSSALRERLNKKHKFIDRLNRGESVSAVAKIRDSEGDEDGLDASEYRRRLEQSEDAENKLAFEKEVEEDAEVSALNNAFLNGSGRKKRNESTDDFVKNLSGKAYDPNKSKLDFYGSSDTKKSQKLTGSFVTNRHEIAPKENKTNKKPFKAWLLYIIFASLYIIGCAVYFFVGFNFGAKAINLSVYELTHTNITKLVYYDGQKFDCAGIKMTYTGKDDAIEEFDLTEINISEPDKNAGYSIKNGYITADFTGAYANSVSRVVRVKMWYNKHVGYIDVTVYKNILTDLKVYCEKDIEFNSYSKLNLSIFGKYVANEATGYTNDIEKQMSSDSFKVYLVSRHTNELINEGNALKTEDGKFIIPTGYSNLNSYLRIVANENTEIVLDMKSA